MHNSISSIFYFHDCILSWPDKDRSGPAKCSKKMVFFEYFIPIKLSTSFFPGSMQPLQPQAEIRLRSSERPTSSETALDIATRTTQRTTMQMPRPWENQNRKSRPWEYQRSSECEYRVSYLKAFCPFIQTQPLKDKFQSWTSEKQNMSFLLKSDSPEGFFHFKKSSRPERNKV